MFIVIVMVIGHTNRMMGDYYYWQQNNCHISLSFFDIAAI